MLKAFFGDGKAFSGAFIMENELLTRCKYAGKLQTRRKQAK
jgi:hypothetical protein